MIKANDVRAIEPHSVPRRAAAIARALAWRVARWRCTAGSMLRMGWDAFEPHAVFRKAAEND